MLGSSGSITFPTAGTDGEWMKVKIKIQDGKWTFEYGS